MDMHGQLGHDRRRFLALTAAASSVPLLSACGAGFGDGDSKSDGSAADDVTGSFDWQRHKGTTVKALLNKHPYTDALIADLKAFTAKTGIKVEYDVFPEDNYFDKLTVDLSSGRASYDIFMLGAYMVWQYGPPGWLEDLGPWMRNESATGAEWDQDDFLPSLLEGTQWSLKAGTPLGQGGQYALPWGWEANVVAYNTEVFNKLGLRPAESFDELRELAGTIKRKAPGAGFDGMYGVAVRGSRSWATIHPGFMTMFSRYKLKDFTVDGESLKPAMNSPEAITFTRDWADMVKKGGPPSWTSYTWYQCSSDLGAKKAGMLFDADTAAYFQAVKGASPAAGKIAFHPGPKGPDGSLATNMWIWSLGMNAKSKKKSAAWLFLQWATGKEHLRKGAIEYNHIDPVRKSVSDDPAYRDKMSELAGFIETFEAVQDQTRIQFTPQEQFFDATTSWASALQEIYGGKSAGPVLNGLADDLASKVG
ncbi:putative ABC transporter-binding protein precursor [Streptomyces sp. S4.7]|uniref:ABC transporter substrate-binding protein n=1 Tax=Streptomyces sp. S4.7 TaxID=2705439 RepID=UPI001398B8E9|nr:sugar ABC transporter substrate-binding protein [Streptomyces sp. S4.7]QHY95499.1 putative ABC transporter-binding protein precursor [Streptomyces sp. S4.7]